MMRSIPRTRSSESLAAQNFHDRPAFQRLRGKLQLGIGGVKWVNIEVPNELWGAASLAIKLTGNGSKLARAASAHVVQALTPAIDPTVAEDYYPKSIIEALDFSPRLTFLEDTACLIVSLILCIFFYTRTTPTSFSPLYALALAALCFSTLVLSRSWLLERHFQAVQRSERELASSDSLFLNVNGVALHYKKALFGNGEREAPATQSSTLDTPPSVAIHCLHGFGASLYSWSMVQNKIATICSALVTSHDMPGFGLSQRPSWPGAYSLAFNGRAAARILDTELNNIINNTNTTHEEEETENNYDGDTSGVLLLSPKSSRLASHPLSSLKKVLIGHSMGGASAAEGAIRHPEEISALILVAPAIVAFWTGVPEAAKQEGAVATGVALAEELVGAEDLPGEIPLGDDAESTDTMTADGFVLIDGSSTIENGNNVEPMHKSTNPAAAKPRHHHRHSLGRVAAAVFHAITSEILRLFLVLATPFMVLLLRKLVRTRSFWERGLASAWFDKKKVSKQYVDSYRLGQLVHGWEYGILRFMGARFSEKAGLWHALASAVDGDGHLSQAEKLAVACSQHNIRILIIHGKDDVLVPVANSKRLAKVLPGAAFVEIDNCGHMPQEEAPERFIEEVEKFIKSL
ncbi:hypothetical protein Ndes2526B_g04483 [Nannochloris sp. 'desiccata']